MGEMGHLSEDHFLTPKASAAPAIDLVSDFDIVCPPSLSRSELRAAAAAREAELISVAHALLADFGILSSATIQLSHADLREVRFRSSPFEISKLPIWAHIPPPPPPPPAAAAPSPISPIAPTSASPLSPPVFSPCFLHV